MRVANRRADEFRIALSVLFVVVVSMNRTGLYIGETEIDCEKMRPVVDDVTGDEVVCHRAPCIRMGPDESSTGLNMMKCTNDERKASIDACQRASLRAIGPLGCLRLQIVVDPLEPLQTIAHDDRGGPFAVGPDGREAEGTLLSVTDEEGCLLHVWAWPEHDSLIVGLGVDLASTADFGGSPEDQQLAELLFTAHERELVQELWPACPSLGYASAIAAHEAAFKSTARPLRQWYESHSEELFFEVMDFALVSPNRVTGDARNGRASKAFERLGIDRIEVAFAELDGMAFALAVALADVQGTLG